MKRTAAALLIMLSLGAAAAAQTLASKALRPRAKRAADGGAKSAPAGVDEVERLLDRYVLAQGGLALSFVRTRIVRGAVEVSFSPQPGTFEMYEKAPTKSLIVFNAPGGQFIFATDGGKMWEKSPWSGVTTRGPVADDVLRPGGGKGFKWRSRFSSVRVKGRVLVEGRPAVALAATPIGRDPIVLYFDVETGLLVKQELIRSGGKKPLALYMDSYATVDGMKVPAVFRQVGEGYTITFRVYEVKHNVSISDALFRDPNAR
ncbi:MAG TPA: hypothetical protein VFZ44_02885 [Pyrinomonadaceae bacterium]